MSCIAKVCRINVVATLTSSSGNTSIRVAEALIGDETATICLLVDGDAAVDLLLGADCIVVSNAHVETFDGHPRLVVHSGGGSVRLYPVPEVCAPGIILESPRTVNTDNCLSFTSLHY